MKKGSLYLIPTLLGEQEVSAVLPAGTLNVINRLEVFITEELKTARRFLRRAGFPKNFEDVSLLVFNEHSSSPDYQTYLEFTEHGHDIGLLSEAGAPCVADPGAEIVRLAHECCIRVVPLTGPSSLLLSLMASGFNGQNFAFAGYVPVDKLQRAKRLKELERKAWDEAQTQIIIETPYRNEQLLKAIIQTCRPNTMLCIASGISLDSESIRVMPVGEWRKINPGLGKIPSVFILSGA